MDYVQEWQFIADAYNGEGGFYDGSYLDKFGREDDTKYDTRKELEKREYENIFTSKVSRYIGYLFKSEPMRETSDSTIAKIKEDVNGKNESIDIFMSNFAKNAKARGVNLVLVDSPKEKAENLKEQLDKRILPYFVEILPERLIDYRLDKFGNFVYVSFSDTIDNSTFDEDDVIDIIRYYDDTEWRIYDTNKGIIGRGEHKSGVCPVLPFAEKGIFESLGEFSQLAGMSKKLFNLQSELKNMMRGQAFSILTIHTVTGSNPSVDVGTDNAIAYTGDHAPSYISSDAAQAALYENRIEKVKESMDRVAYDVTTTTANESGISLEIKFQGLNSSLASFAQRMEDFEKRLWDVVCFKLNIQQKMTIQYNTDFSITDINADITILDSVNRVANLPLYKAEKLKNIANADLINADDETKDKINQEIDEIVGKMSELGQPI